MTPRILGVPRLEPVTPPLQALEMDDRGTPRRRRPLLQRLRLAQESGGSLRLSPADVRWILSRIG